MNIGKRAEWCCPSSIDGALALRELAHGMLASVHMHIDGFDEKFIEIL